jgi:hypothetical protein
VPQENVWCTYHFCGTCSTETGNHWSLTTTLKFSFAFQGRFQSVSFVIVLTFLKKSMSFGASTCHDVECPRSTNIMNIFEEVRVDKGLYARNGRVEGLFVY